MLSQIDEPITAEFLDDHRRRDLYRLILKGFRGAESLPDNLLKVDYMSEAWRINVLDGVRLYVLKGDESVEYVHQVALGLLKGALYNIIEGIDSIYNPELLEDEDE